MLRGLKVISEVMLLSSGNSQSADGREINIKPTIYRFHMLLKGYGRSPKEQGMGQKTLSYFSLER